MYIQRIPDGTSDEESEESAEEEDSTLLPSPDALKGVWACPQGQAFVLELAQRFNPSETGTSTNFKKFEKKVTTAINKALPYVLVNTNDLPPLEGDNLPVSLLEEPS